MRQGQRKRAGGSAEGGKGGKLLPEAEFAVTFAGAGTGMPTPAFQSTWSLPHAGQYPLPLSSSRRLASS